MSLQMPFFSVIIPLFNKANFVTQAIESILCQQFSDFEIIVVDDFSTDNSLEMVKKIESDKIKIIRHTSNKGLSAARNTGIQCAKSEFVTLLDADDFWDVGFLLKIKSLIDNFPNADLFATNYLEFYPNGALILPKNSFENDQIVDDFFLSNLGKPIYCSCSLCIRKSVFENVGFYDEQIKFGEDVDFNIRSNLKHKLAYSNQGLMIYRMFSENQITNSSLKNKKITDFAKYEVENPNHLSLQKYLDFNRYVMAKMYKMEGDFINFKKLKSQISSKNLNYKQKILLNLPVFTLKIVAKIKLFLVQKNIQLSSYDAYLTTSKKSS